MIPNGIPGWSRTVSGRSRKGVRLRRNDFHRQL